MRSIRGKTPEAKAWLESLPNVEGRIEFPEKFRADLHKHFCYVGRKPKEGRHER